MTISGLNITFDHLFCLLTLSDQAVNVSSTDDFALNPCSRLLSYHCYCCRLLLYHAVNISSIDKLINCRFCSTSLSMSNQTFVGADTLWIHNLCPRYSNNSRHCLNMANSLITMNQELLQLKDWVSPTVPNSQEKFANN